MATFFHRRKGGVSWGFGVNRAEGGRKKAKMGENGRWMGGGDLCDEEIAGERYGSEH